MRRRLAVFAPPGTVLILLLVLFAGCGRQRPTVVPEACPPFSPVVMPPDAPVWLPVAGRVVILDPGHGGKDGGAAHHGLREKDINLDLAFRTARLLRARGVTVHMTRSSDVFVSLAERSAFANRNPGAVFVSVHVNAAGNANAFGIETFVLSKDFTDEERGKTAGEKFRLDGADSEYGRRALANLATGSRARGRDLADDVQTSLTAKLGDPNRGVKTANLAVLRETYLCPAALVEVGFLTHAPTAARMAGEDWRRRTAEALTDGIVAFLRRPH